MSATITASDNENEMAAELRAKAGEYLQAAYEEQQLTNKSDVDAVAHKYKLDPEVTKRWFNGLEAWNKTSNAVFAPWFKFAALPEKDFAAKTKELSASFGSKSDAAAINPIVAKSFAENPPASA